jgi:ribosomal protein L37AE/L43A
MIVPVMKMKCSRCGYEWIPRSPEIWICAGCKVPLEKYRPKIIIEGPIKDFEVIKREEEKQ